MTRFFTCIMAAFLCIGAAHTQDKIVPIPRHVCGPDVMDRGIASVYDTTFDGRETASGEILDVEAITAAHPSVPFGNVVKVTDARSRKSIMVRINDRGPFVEGRVIDLTPAAMRALGHKHPGLYKVSVKLCR